jgi:hypothetical protein
MSTRQRLLLAAAAMAVAGVIVLALLAYRQPGLLLEFLNIRYCG